MDSLIMDIIEKDHIDEEENLEIEHLQEFKEEALEILETLEENIISLDKNNINSEITKEIFRAFHSIKGIAGFASQSLVEIIAHQTENILTKIQNGIIEYDTVVLEILINSVELMKQICKDFALVKDKKLNEIVKIHLSNIKNLKVKEHKKLEILNGCIFENEDYVKIPTQKIEDLFSLLKTMKNLNKNLNITNVEQYKKELNTELEKIENYLSRFKNQELEYLYKKLDKVAKYTLKTVGIDCEFLCEGGEILVEKKLMNKLFIPLSQIIRNAITHGLFYKKGEKHIKVKSYKKNNKLTVLVENNGIEINKIKITNKLKEKNIIFFDENILNAVFLSGFSTKNQEDIISGRGVGLDIVKKEIEKMKGSISVFSESGKGTIFKIELPLKKI